jgi:uncharacterized protein
MTQPLCDPGRDPDWGAAATPVAQGAEPVLRDVSWYASRSFMEANRIKSMPDRKRRRRRWSPFKFCMRRFGEVLWLTGLHERGRRNALRLRLNAFEVAFDDLPEAFDGYRILHLTDLHLDALPGLSEALVALLDGVETDICVLTGDYRYHLDGPFDHILPMLQSVVDRIAAPDGSYAILGNHDSVAMVRPLEDIGLRVLVNETLALRRRDQHLHLLGIDDVHYYYTDHALDALGTADGGFTVALVHSPEFFEQAAAGGVALYLTGHTHAGQVCLPGGIPIVTNLRRRRRLASGLWRHGAMVGYTGAGVGVSGVPVRFNCQGEAALITLRKRRAD